MADELGALRDFPTALGLLVQWSGMKRTEIARNSNVARSSLYRYMEGAMYPGLPTLGKLLEAMGMDASDLAKALAVAQGVGPSEKDLYEAIELLAVKLGISPPASPAISKSRGSGDRHK